MSITCTELREAMQSGREGADPRIKAHLDACTACAALTEAAGPLRSATSEGGEVSPDLANTLAAVETRIASEDTQLGAYLRSRSTRTRMFFALASAATIVLSTLLLFPRADMARYPAGRFGIVMGLMAGALFTSIALALRPAHRPVISQGLASGFTALALVVLLALSAWPLPGHEGADADAASRLIPTALPCFCFGLILGLPIFFLIRAIDPGVTSLAARLAALSAGMTANIALTLHCPISTPTHVLAGHATVAIAFVVLVFAVPLLRAKR